MIEEELSKTTFVIFESVLITHLFENTDFFFCSPVCLVYLLGYVYVDNADISKKILFLDIALTAVLLNSPLKSVQKWDLKNLF